jgi:hypothetical protein
MSRSRDNCNPEWRLSQEGIRDSYSEVLDLDLVPHGKMMEIDQQTRDLLDKSCWMVEMEINFASGKLEDAGSQTLRRGEAWIEQKIFHNPLYVDRRSGEILAVDSGKGGELIANETEPGRVRELTLRIFMEDPNERVAIDNRPRSYSYEILGPINPLDGNFVPLENCVSAEAVENLEIIAAACSNEYQDY